MGIFAETAPRYWAAGLPVIPLMTGEKRPAINSWQTFADAFPDQELRDQWLVAYENNNIGLPLGPCAGLVAIDIDTLEPEVEAIIEGLLPPSPWKRVGKKGSVRLYRWNHHRTARIRKADGSTVVEILSKGSQIAIPPSIHPDTGLPYTANADLVDVLSIIQDLPQNFEDRLRAALEAAGVKLSSKGSATVTKWVPAGARDNAMVAHAGLLSRGILMGERTLLEALAEIAEWCASFVEHVAGDAIDPAKAQGKVIEFLVRDVQNGKRVLPPGWDAGLTDEDKEKLGLQFEEEHELWTYQRIKDYMHAQFELHEPASAGRLGAIEFALARLAQNKDMTSIEEESLLRYMNDASQRQIPVAALKSRLKELRQNGISGNDHTEIAEAVLKELETYGAIKYFGGQFWQWKGSHWAPLSDEHVMRVIAKEFGDLPGARKNTDHRGILKTAANLAGADPDGNDIVDLTENEAIGINFANGFLTWDLELLPHDPSFGMTYVLPYRYMPDLTGHCPMFHQLLHDVWGDDPDFEDKIQALREAMAATLFQISTRYERAICLLGIARSGKSTIMEIMQGLMPSAARCAIPPTKWGEKFDPAEMAGKLLNVCGELSESKFIEGDTFKEILGGHEISAQFKGQPLFKFKPKCAHWFATNHMPRSRDTSGGFTRRWLILEFCRSIPMDKVIDRYHEYILAEEIEAIAAWAVQGVVDLRKNHGFTLPGSTMAALDDMAKINNSVRTFLKSCSRVVRKEDASCREYDLYMEYRTFCVAVVGVQPSQLQTFGNRMKELQIEFGFRRDVKIENDVDVVEYTGLAVNRKAK